MSPDIQPQFDFDFAVDCREMTKPKFSALAQILVSLLRDNSEFTYLLLSDIPLPAELVPEGATNVVWGRSAPSGLQVVRYQYWMKRTVDAHSVQYFYEVDHYALFRLKAATRITTIHDLYVLEGIEHYPVRHRLPYKLFTRATLRNSDIIHVDTKFTESRLRKMFGARVPKVVVVPVGIDPPLTKAEPVTSLEGKRFLLALGRLSYWKGTAALAAMFQEHLSSSGLNLVFAGRCDEREFEAKAAVEALVEGCPDVVWLDYVSHAQREWLLQNAAVLCYPSRYDGFGMPPVEAALRGTPCLMSDIPVLREVTGNLGQYVDFFGRPTDAAHRLQEMSREKDQPNAVELQQLASSYSWHHFFARVIDGSRRSSDQR